MKTNPILQQNTFYDKRIMNRCANCTKKGIYNPLRG